MKLTFDAGRCDGMGMCAVVFPEGISLDRWGFAQVDAGEILDPKLQRKARRAAGCCPRGAIAVIPADISPTPNTNVSPHRPQ